MENNQNQLNPISKNIENDIGKANNYNYKSIIEYILSWNKATKNNGLDFNFANQPEYKLFPVPFEKLPKGPPLQLNITDQIN
jgi:hypothetical protein